MSASLLVCIKPVISEVISDTLGTDRDQSLHDRGRYIFAMSRSKLAEVIVEVIFIASLGCETKAVTNPSLMQNSDGCS